MDIKKLQAVVIDALEDIKAQDIKVFDTTHLTSLFDRVAVASGTSNRQTKALAASVRDKVKESGGNIVSIEGEDTGEWVLVDLGDMIVHIMQPPIRAYYRLEEIWGEKEVKWGAAKRTSKRANAKSEEAAAPAKKAGKHLAASQTTTDEAPKKTARKATSETSAPKKRAIKAPAGKTVKVATSKSASAPKKSAAKSATGAAKRAPAKRAAKAKPAE
jgi:ribosome-associated protein